MTTVIREKDIQEIRQNQESLLNILQAQRESFEELSTAVQEAIRSLSEGVSSIAELAVSSAGNIEGSSKIISEMQEEIKQLKAGLETVEKVTGVTSM